MKKNTLSFFILFVNLTLVFSQGGALSNNKSSVIQLVDTIEINKQYNLVIHLPSKSIKTISAYQGGYFVSYFIPKDTVAFSVYSGPLPEDPFLSGSSCTVMDSILVEDVFFERRGYCLKSNESFASKKGYFREKEYMLLLYSAKYEWVDVTKVGLYDQVFSDIEILEK